MRFCPAPIAAVAVQPAAPGTAPGSETGLTRATTVPADPAGAIAAAAPVQPSSEAVERVVQAVRLLQEGPPPTSVMVEMPDLGGLRIGVSLRGDAVHLAVPTGAVSQFGSWLNELVDALNRHGFEFAGYGERGSGGDPERHRRRQQQGSHEPFDWLRLKQTHDSGR